MCSYLRTVQNSCLLIKRFSLFGVVLVGFLGVFMKSLKYLWVLALTGCVAVNATSPTGSWRPVNQYTSNVQEIMLQKPHVFSASPLDMTLRTLLMRWSQESGARLQYEHMSDFTLQSRVANIQQNNLADAIKQLNAIYQSHGVLISAPSDAMILVTPAPEEVKVSKLGRSKSVIEPEPVVAPITTPAVDATEPLVTTPPAETVTSLSENALKK